MTQLSTRPSIGSVLLSGRQRASVARHRYWEAVLKDSPTVFWPLNESPGATVAKDWSGHGYDGAVAIGHQTLVFGEPGYTSDGATALAQTSDPGDYTNPAAVGNTDISLTGAARPITIEYAASNVSSDFIGDIITIGQLEGVHNVWVLYIDGAEPTASVAGGDWTWETGIDATGPIMHHYALTYSGSGAPLLYVDGAVQGAPTVRLAPAPNVTRPGVFVSGDPGLGDDGRMTVADVAVYDYALTAAQIAAHVAAR